MQSRIRNSNKASDLHRRVHLESQTRFSETGCKKHLYQLWAGQVDVRATSRHPTQPQFAVSPLFWVSNPWRYCCCNGVCTGVPHGPRPGGSKSLHSCLMQGTWPCTQPFEDNPQLLPYSFPLVLGVERPNILRTKHPLRLKLFSAVFPQALAASSLGCFGTWEYLLWKFCTISQQGQKQPTQVLS